MSRITSAIESIQGLVFTGPIPVSEIDKAEKSLSLAFNQEYREYIEKFGVISFDKHELTGISSIDRLHVVSTTQAERERFFQIPNDWYVIEELHIDDMVVWQDRNGALYQATPNGLPAKIADSLVDYILM